MEAIEELVVPARPQEARTLPRELSLTARLGGPLALGELGWMSTYIVDALMIGRLPHSALSISASSLGNTIFYAIAFGAVYLLTGVETLVAQAYGRGDRQDGARTLFQSLWIVLLATPVVMLATLGSIPLLSRFGVPPDIVGETARYLHALVWSAAPLLLYMALRRYLQSVDRVLLVMVSLLTAAVVNLAGDWAFLYGHLGLHSMGIAGSGWATCIVRVYTAALLIFGVARGWKSAEHRLELRPDFTRLRLLLKIGWPAALQSFTDLSISTVMSIFCARLGATLLAAHQVVLDLDAFVYMVPLGLSYATAVRVGQGAGRNSLPQVRRSANASLLLGMGFISAGALCFTSFRHLWASLYTNDTSVVAAAAPIFLICGVIQLGDAAGAIYEGALKGLGDTRTPMLVNMAWYWAMGMPLGYWLTFHDGMGLRGLWLGRCAAAVATATHLAVVWFLRIQSEKSEMHRPALSLLLPPHAGWT